ncbi:MAG: VOC family protein [Halomonadaceae bacterium]|nr:MAG: VOC family protein [Halomonadaceae bacterium]
MIGYTTLGTKNLENAAAFYDALFESLGAKRVFNTENLIAWGAEKTGPYFSVTSPYDGQDATVGNGVMVALNASSTGQVDELHARALELGATNDGDPGLRAGGFYCGYFRDLDGNKLNFFCFG